MLLKHYRHIRWLLLPRGWKDVGRWASGIGILLGLIGMKIAAWHESLFWMFFAEGVAGICFLLTKKLQTPEEKEMQRYRQSPPIQRGIDEP